MIPGVSAKGGAVHPAGDLQRTTRVDRGEAAQSLFQSHAVLGSGHPQIDLAAGLLGDHVRPAAAPNRRDVQGHAVFEIDHGVDAADLRGQFHDRRRALRECAAGVRSDAADPQFEPAHTLACGDTGAVGVGRFDDQHATRALALVLDQRARCG